MSTAYEEAFVATTIQRDRYGRPMIVPPRGKKPVAYTRCTTYIDVLEDKYNLQKWMQRQTALGLSRRSDLLLAVAAHRDDKSELDRICDQAKEAAAASAAATTGTALHSLTEAVDRGQELPALPAGAQASLEAYREAMTGIKIVDIERFLVADKIKVGGTCDRIVEIDGQRYIADIKTGSIEYGALKIAMQLSIYARSVTYDPGTYERTEHGASLERGLVIHLPATDDPKQARCHLWWIDLEAGYSAVQVAGLVREKRKATFKQLTQPYEGPLPQPAPRHASPEDARRHAEILDSIDRAATPEAVRALWAEWWTSDLVEYARARVAALTDSPNVA